MFKEKRSVNAFDLIWYQLGTRKINLMEVWPCHAKEANSHVFPGFFMLKCCISKNFQANLCGCSNDNR